MMFKKSVFSGEFFNNGEKGKKEKLSRREFLKGAGALAGLSLAGIFLGETPRAWSKEVKDGALWLEGIENLRDEALHADVERLALYIVDKTGVGEWRGDTEGEAKRIASPVEKIREELLHEPQKLSVAHTHLLSQISLTDGILFSEDQVAAVREESLYPPPMPPSALDVFTSIKLAFDNKGTSTEITVLVVDPRGVWEYSINLENIDVVMQKALQHRQNYLEGKAVLEKDLTVSEVRATNSFRDAKELLQHLLKQKSGIVSPETREHVLKMLEALRFFEEKVSLMMDTLQEQVIQYLSESIDNPDLDPRPFFKNYEVFGITDMTFKTFDQIREEAKG